MSWRVSQAPYPPGYAEHSYQNSFITMPVPIFLYGLKIKLNSVAFLLGEKRRPWDWLCTAVTQTSLAHTCAFSPLEASSPISHIWKASSRQVVNSLPPAPTGFWAEGCSTSIPGDLTYEVALNFWGLRFFWGMGGTGLGGWGDFSTGVTVGCGAAVTGLSCRNGNASFPLKELCFRLKGAGRFF